MSDLQDNDSGDSTAAIVPPSNSVTVSFEASFSRHVEPIEQQIAVLQQQQHDQWDRLSAAIDELVAASHLTGAETEVPATALNAFSYLAPIVQTLRILQTFHDDKDHPAAATVRAAQMANRLRPLAQRVWSIVLAQAGDALAAWTVSSAPTGPGWESLAEARWALCPVNAGVTNATARWDMVTLVGQIGRIVEDLQTDLDLIRVGEADAVATTFLTTSMLDDPADTYIKSQSGTDPESHQVPAGIPVLCRLVEGSPPNEDDLARPSTTQRVCDLYRGISRAAALAYKAWPPCLRPAWAAPLFLPVLIVNVAPTTRSHAGGSDRSVASSSIAKKRRVRASAPVAGHDNHTALPKGRDLPRVLGVEAAKWIDRAAAALAPVAAAARDVSGGSKTAQRDPALRRHVGLICCEAAGRGAAMSDPARGIGRDKDEDEERSTRWYVIDALPHLRRITVYTWLGVPTGTAATARGMADQELDDECLAWVFLVGESLTSACQAATRALSAAAESHVCDDIWSCETVKLTSPRLARNPALCKSTDALALETLYHLTQVDLSPDSISSPHLSALSSRLDAIRRLFDGPSGVAMLRAWQLKRTLTLLMLAKPVWKIAYEGKLHDG